MERLIDDASKLDKSVKKGDKSFANIVRAIHAVQKNLDITGTTAKEASETISGSASAMQSAWSNLLVGMADPEQDFNGLLNNFISSMQVFSGNVLKLLPNISTGIERLIKGLTPFIGEMVISILPTLLTAASSLISGLMSALPGILQVLTQIGTQIVGNITGDISTLLPEIMNSAISLITAFATTLLENIPNILVAGAAMVQHLVNDISGYLPGLLFQGSQALNSFVSGIIENLPTLLDTALQIINTIITDLGIYIPWMLERGASLLTMLIQGISSNLPSLMATALEIIQKLIEDITTYAPMLIGAGWLVFNKLVQELPGILKSAADQVIGFIDDLGNQLAEKYPSLSWVFENLETIIGGVVTAIVAFKAAMFVKDVMDKASTGIQSVGKTLMSIFSTIATHPIGAAIAAIAALVAGLIILYNNNEDFRNFVNDAWTKIKNWIVNAKNGIVGAWNTIKTKAGELWDKIKGVKDNIVGAFDKLKSKATEIKDHITSAFETLKNNVKTKWDNIKSSIMNPINTVKTWLDDKIQKIKDLFDFDWSFPKPKMPHFKIKGTLDLLTWPPKIPTVSIDWYRKAMNNAMLLNDATIFGASNGRLLGGGEAGPEVVSGANTLMGMIKDAVRETGSGIGQVIINIDGAQYEDADELANVIAEKLQGIVSRREAAWA